MPKKVKVPPDPGTIKKIHDRKQKSNDAIASINAHLAKPGIKDQTFALAAFSVWQDNVNNLAALEIDENTTGGVVVAN